MNTLKGLLELMTADLSRQALWLDEITGWHTLEAHRLKLILKSETGK